MLESLRQIERKFFYNPTLSIADYPMLERELFEIQESESLIFDYSVNSLCYIYISENLMAIGLLIFIYIMLIILIIRSTEDVLLLLLVYK